MRRLITSRKHQCFTAAVKAARREWIRLASSNYKTLFSQHRVIAFKQEARSSCGGRSKHWLFSSRCDVLCRGTKAPPAAWLRALVCWNWGPDTGVLFCMVFIVKQSELPKLTWALGGAPGLLGHSHRKQETKSGNYREQKQQRHQDRHRKNLQETWSCHGSLCSAKDLLSLLNPHW